MRRKLRGYHWSQPQYVWSYSIGEEPLAIVVMQFDPPAISYQEIKRFPFKEGQVESENFAIYDAEKYIDAVYDGKETAIGKMRK